MAKQVHGTAVHLLGLLLLSRPTPVSRSWSGAAKRDLDTIIMMPARPHWRKYWREYCQYWVFLLRSFRQHVAGHWPIFATLLLFPLLSGGLLWWVESHGGHQITTYWDAVYVTWITMATVGYGEKVPQTPVGKFIVSFDALVGLVLIGVIVWAFTVSLQRSRGMRDESGRR